MKFEEFRDSLLESYVPPRRLASPLRQLTRFLLVAGLFVALVVVLVGARGDLILQGHLGHYLIEDGLIFLIAALSGFAALLMARPGRGIGWLIVLITLVSAGWLSLIWFSAPRIEETLPDPDYACASLVLVSTIVCGFFIQAMLSRGFVTSPKTASYFAFLSSAAIGALLLQIVCPGFGLAHLLGWHVIPTVLIPTVFSMLWPRVSKLLMS